MKKFTTEEIKGLLNQVYREEISFSRMVEVINQRLSERMKEMTEPHYKDGDFVYEDGRIMIVKSCPNIYHVNACPIFSGKLSYDGAYGVNFSESTFRYATAEEKQELIELLRKDGKQWNEEKKCVEDIPTELKEGDFVDGLGCVIIFHTQIDNYSAKYHVLYEKNNGMLWYDKTYTQFGGIDKLRLATDAGKQELLDALAKEGKRWNEDKKCVEDVPVRKFKKGDKVRIKKGISSKTHGEDYPYFTEYLDEYLDEYIGRTMTVMGYVSNPIGTYVQLNEAKDGTHNFGFAEDWIEPYEELKKGDLAIFWDDYKEFAIIRIYDQSNESDEYFRHKDTQGVNWKNAIKFESKEQYERLIKGEI